MDKQRMTFQADHRAVTEGDVVELTWDCTGSEQTELTIDNGFRATQLTLEAAGSKRFRLNRSKGRTHFTIAAIVDGKTYRKKIAVQVRPMPTVHAETIDHRGRKVGTLGQWWQGVVTKRHDWRAKTRMALQSLPERKQMAVKLLAIIGVAMMVSAFWPAATTIGLTLMMVYLLIVLMRRN